MKHIVEATAKTIVENIKIVNEYTEAITEYAETLEKIVIELLKIIEDENPTKAEEIKNTLIKEHLTNMLR